LSEAKEVTKVVRRKSHI